MNDERVEVWANLFAISTNKEERDLLWRIAEDSGEMREAELGLFCSTNPDRLGRDQSR